MDNGMATTKTVVWKEHKEFLAKGVQDLFLKEDQMDTNVTFEGDVLKVHRIILTIFLPTFKSSLGVVSSDGSGSMRELNLNSVANHMEDVRALIEFIYTGKMTVAEGRLDHLRSLADDLSFDGLAKALDDECQSNQTNDATSLDLLGRQQLRAAAVVKLERIDVDDDDDGQEWSDEEGEGEEAMDDDDSEYRPTSEDDSNNEDKASGPHRTKPVKGNISRTRPTSRNISQAKGAKGKVTKVDEDDINRYCEAVFKSLKEGRAPEQQASSSSDADIKKRCKRPGRKMAARPRLTDEGTYKCEKCNREFAKIRPLQRHMKQCGLLRLVACRFCDHMADTPKLLHRHLFDVHRREVTTERRNRVNQFKCAEPQCKFAAHNELRLKMHLKRMHSTDKKYKCDECEYSAIRRSELTTHVNTIHLKQKNFQCDHCGQRYSTRSGLFRHVRAAHQGYKHYKCEHCGKEFNTSKCYSVHVQSKHNVGGEVEMHVCDMCGKSYNRRWNLQLHMRRVHKKSLESRVQVHAPRCKDPSPDGNVVSATSLSSQQQASEPTATVPTASSTADGHRQTQESGQVVECHAETSSQQPRQQNNLFQATHPTTYMPTATSAWFGAIDRTIMP